MTAWRPPIEDPADGPAIDGRVLCTSCGREGTEEEPLMVMHDGEELCGDCRYDHTIAI